MITKMKNSFLYAFIFLILIGCNSKKGAYNFEKIIFHSSRCFGSCPIINLQVNSDKSILLSKTPSSTMKKASVSANNDELEYFKGTLSDNLFNKLTSELAKTQNVNFEGINCCDAPLKSMIIYQGGKRKEIETMFPPEESANLIATLYEISSLENLTKVSEKFEIETIKHQE